MAAFQTTVNKHSSFRFLFCVLSVFVSYVEAAEMGFPWRVAGVSLEIG